MALIVFEYRAAENFGNMCKIWKVAKQNLRLKNPQF